MNRRQVIQSLGLISGHALFPSILSGFLTACAHKEMSGYTPEFFTPEEYDAVVEVVDIIIPATVTQSASQLNTQIFLDQVFARCLNSSQQQLVRDGLAQLIPGLDDADDKAAFLSEIDRKAYANDEDAAYFKLIKQYTLVGFFTSQEGTTKASNYVKIPDGYKGEIPADEKTLNYGKTTLNFYL